MQEDGPMNEITAEQLRELKMMFDYFDVDGSGALDTDVRHCLLRSWASSSR